MNRLRCLPNTKQNDWTTLIRTWKDAYKVN
jgi:hypothetical protein